MRDLRHVVIFVVSSRPSAIGGLGALEVEQVGKGQDAHVGFLVIVFVVVGAAYLVDKHGDRELELTALLGREDVTALVPGAEHAI